MSGHEKIYILLPLAAFSSNLFCQQDSIITVTDTVPPMFTAPTDQVKLAPPDSSGYTTSGNEFDRVRVYDNSPFLAVTNNLNGGITLDGFVFDHGDTVVTLTATDVCGNISECTFTVTVLTPGLSITKTQTSTEDITSAGQTITYEIIITNTGTSNLTGVQVTEFLPGAGAGSLSVPSESISANDTLDVGETWTCTATSTVTQEDIDAGDDIINIVTVSTNELPDPVTATESTPVLGITSLTIMKTQTSNVYPNPSMNLVTIQAGIIGTYTVEITSLNGQLLYTDKMEGPTHQIDLSSFQKGLYFITVRSRDYIRTEKIIKQ